MSRSEDCPYEAIYGVHAEVCCDEKPGREATCPAYADGQHRVGPYLDVDSGTRYVGCVCQDALGLCPYCSVSLEAQCPTHGPDVGRETTACDCCQECRWRYGDMLGQARLEVRERLGVMRLALERIAAEDWRGHEPESVRIAREALTAPARETP